MSWELCFSLTLSDAYVGPKSRTERPRKTKIDTDVAHVTPDSDTTFEVKRSKVKVTRPLYSRPCWRVRQLQRWAREHVGRGKLLLRSVCSDARGASALTGEERGLGIPRRPPTYSLLFSVYPSFILKSDK